MQIRTNEMIKDYDRYIQESPRQRARRVMLELDLKFLCDCIKEMESEPDPAPVPDLKLRPQIRVDVDRDGFRYWYVWWPPPRGWWSQIGQQSL